MKLTYFLMLFLAFNLVIVSAQDDSTNTTGENISQNVEPPKLVCSDKQCDSECVKCDDGCHEPKFKCEEKLSVERIVPTEIDYGVSQINILLRNTGNTNLRDLSAELTGDGIVSLEKTGIRKLVAGDKDYVFVKINATKPGIIDVVVKVYVGDSVKGKLVEQFEVAQNAEPEKEQPQYNATQLTESLAAMRQTYKLLEQDYQDKKSQGYGVELVYDKLKEASGYISDAQAALFESDYKKVSSELVVLNVILDDIKSNLDSIKKPQESFTAKIRNNLLFFGSIAAAIVSIITATKLIKNSVDHKKLLKKLGKKRAAELKKREEKMKKKEIELDEA